MPSSSRFAAITPEGERRYSRATGIGCESNPVRGFPDAKHVVRWATNLTMRMSMRRLTNPSSKKGENHTHANSAHFIHVMFSGSTGVM